MVLVCEITNKSQTKERYAVINQRTRPKQCPDDVAEHQSHPMDTMLVQRLKVVQSENISISGRALDQSRPLTL